MSYRRVIPRDLFNEASLLKCYGQLYLNLENLGLQDCLEQEDDSGPFDVVQDRGDGSLFLMNVSLWVRGRQVRLRRPLNSRRSYPLWAYPDEDTEFEVFNDDGTFAEDMNAFLRNNT